MDTKPKIKTPKKRFTSREQIITRIDKFTKKAGNQRRQQRECYTRAGQIRRSAHDSQDTTLLPEAIKKDKEGDKWGLKADRLEKDVLGSLRSKLAEFDTETIPGITTDRSVPS